MHYRALLLLPLLTSFAACQPTVGGSDGSDVSVNYCSVETPGARIELERPGPGEEPVDDVNWFARPVPNESGDWIIAFASHSQNYLYNLSQGTRVKIPDRSDAVATPDGRYMTVPSNYTPDEHIRFYDARELLDHLDRGEDADGLPPVFVHDHPDLTKVYYQSTGIVSRDDESTVYRLMFSGTASESGFRIVDYTFKGEGSTLQVTPTEPMKLCPEIPNDLNTPFISKGRSLRRLLYELE